MTQPAGQGTTQERRPLVIGYGSTLRRDDAVGVRAAELLSVDPRLDGSNVLAVHQLTPELALDIGAASFLVLVDADLSAEPGAASVRPISGANSDPAVTGRPETGSSSHHVGVAELLALARELTGHAPKGAVVAVGVADLGMGEGLSPSVEAALPRIIELVADLVAGARTQVLR